MSTDRSQVVRAYDLSEFDRVWPGEYRLDSIPDLEEPLNTLPVEDHECRKPRRKSYRWRTV